MTNKEALIAATELNSDQAFEEAYKGKGFYQYFTLQLIAILLVVICLASISLLYFYQQSKQTQAVVNDQLVPLQTQFLQQSYLIKANKLIDDISQNFDIHRLIALQQELSLQSKKLSLLDSSHHSRYQEWFTQNKAATDLLTSIALSNARNILLKDNALIQLDTLLDAIGIQLRKQDEDVESLSLLREVQQSLMVIVRMLERLNLQTSLGQFEQLRVYIDELFVADYGKQLAAQPNNSLMVEEIVRDFIRFEDLVLKLGLLTKWQGELRLIDGYQQQLATEKQQLNSIIDSIDTSTNTKFIGNKQALEQNELPMLLWISYLLCLVSAAALLWLIRLRIKLSSELSVEYLSHVLDGTDSALIPQEKNAFRASQQKAFYCVESLQLLQKIKQHNNGNFTEAEHLLLLDENQELTKQITKDESKQEQLKIELDLVEFNALAKSKSQLFLEQQRCKNLHLAAIKQLVLLGCCAVNNRISTKESGKFNNKDNYLYQSHIQGRDLLRKLRQASCYRYLQTSDAVLTLSDINLIAQIQAILLNLENKFSQFNNSVSLSIDEKILAKVNLDAELFAELFRTFIRLLISQQTEKKLILRLKLVDKNNGQQKICFSGEVQGVDKKKQLPKAISSFNETNSKQSELGEYFDYLLQYQHGDNVCANLTEQGYQLSFTLPLAVINDTQQQSHSTMDLPDEFTAVEDVTSKLTAKYNPMPIEAILAVENPRQYQRLQTLLKAMGLQVTFATNETMLQKYWQSGRFALLITEIPCTPFVSFMVDEILVSQEKNALPRGIFTLDDSLTLTAEEGDFSHWNQGKLSANSSVDSLVMAMLPWVQERVSEISTTKYVSEVDSVNSTIISGEVGEHTVTTTLNNSHSFNFERYIKHQGSAELALYMLEDYTAENTVLVERLDKAIAIDDNVEIGFTIKALALNGKILAADELIHLCQLWGKLLDSQGINNKDIQMGLLNKTKKEILAINQHAVAVV